MSLVKANLVSKQDLKREQMSTDCSRNIPKYDTSKEDNRWGGLIMSFLECCQNSQATKIDHKSC